MTKTLVFGLLAASVFASPAWAGNDYQPPEQVEGGARAMSGAPVADNQVFGSIPAVEFSVTQNKQEVTLGYSIISVGNKPTSNPNETHGTTTRFGFTASTTLKEGQDDKNLLTLNGFTGGTSIGLHFAHSWTTLGKGSAVDNVLSEAVKVATERCLADPENRARYKPEALEKECNGSNGGQGDLVATYYPEGNDEALKVQFKNPITPFVGFDLTGNQDSFAYLDRPTFSIKKEKKFGYEARAYVGGVSRDHPFGARISVTFARKYDEADPVNLCQATLVPGQTQCLSGADGPTTATEQRAVGGQFFLAFGKDKRQVPRFAIAPAVSYDWKNDVFEVNAPIYFARNADHQLSGGVRIDFIDEPNPTGGRKTDFSIGLFIGVPLSWGL